MFRTKSYRLYSPCRNYRVVSEICYNNDLGQYRTYGMTAIYPDCKVIVHDVSVCKDTVIRMAELFNQCKLSPLHLQDAVEDMLP